MSDRLFRALGADWDQFKTLLAVSIRMDFRGHRGMGGHRRRLSPIVGSLIFYVWMGGFLAGSLVTKATPFLYSLLTLAYSMVMMAFAVILEFGNTIINPEDRDVLAFRPISSRTYFLARFCNLLFYVVLIGTALCLAPALLGMLVQGAFWMFPLAFFPVAMMANLATASFVVLIYTGLMRVMQYERFKDVLAYFQMGITFIIFFSYQLIPRMSREFIQRGGDVSGTWLYAAPPAWFAGCIQVLMGMNRGIDSSLAVIAVMSTGLLVLFSFRRISMQYAYLITKLGTGPETIKQKKTPEVEFHRRSVVNQWIEKLLRYPEAKAGFHFTLNLLKRDRSVKMGIYPVFGIPFAIIFLALLENELTDPFVARPFSGQVGLSSMVVFFIFFMIYFFLMGLIYSRDWEASWFYHVAPMNSPGRFYQGIKLAILLRLMLPFYVLLGIIYCTQIPLLHGIRHTFTLFLFGLVSFSAVSFLVKEYPFSKKRERGERTQRFAFLFFVMPFFGLTLLIQMVTYQHNLGWWVLQGGLIVLFFILESRVIKRLDRVLRHKEFFA